MKRSVADYSAEDKVI
jgi:hypothetical protein